MHANRPSILKPAMTYGVIIALVMIILSVLAWILGEEGALWLSFINWIAYFGILYYCLKNWRDKYKGGYITYGMAFKSGVIFMFFASIIFAFYNLIYMTWIDPQYMDRLMDVAEETYYNQGMSDEQIDLALSMFSKMKSPGVQFFSVIFGTTLIGVVISLIVSIFVKREGDPFRQAMSEIDENDKQ